MAHLFLRFLDASKAFDLANHEILFNRLLKPPVIIYYVVYCIYGILVITCVHTAKSEWLLNNHNQ